MTVALARRMVWDGLVTSDDVSRALQVHVTRRVAFLQALSTALPGTVERLDAELGPRAVARDAKIVADPELLAALPDGLPAMLLAVPIGRDPSTGAVRVVALEAVDPHLSIELGYHLGTPIELVPASPLALLSAVAALSVAPTSFRSSDAPIPLVRVSSEPAPPGPTTVKGVAPQAPLGIRGPGSPVVVAPRLGMTPPSEPVIQLTRTKSIGPPARPAPVAQGKVPGDTLIGPVSPGAPPGGPREGSGGHAPESRPVPTSRNIGTPAMASSPSASDDTEIEAGLAQAFDGAVSADEVAVALARGLGNVARKVVVLAIRGKVFEGRESNDPASRPGVRGIVISTERPSVLLTAVQAGHYLGPIPQTLVHRELSDALGAPGDEIAVGVVTVSGRAALVYAAAGLDTPYLATRRGELLSRAAGRRIERLVRDRKR